MLKVLYTSLISLILSPALVLCAFIGTSCSNGKTGATALPNQPVVSASKYGTISCMLDGKQKLFNLKQSYFEITLDPDTKGPADGIEIMDGDNKKEGFQFEFKKTGTTRMGGSAPGEIYCIINYYNPAAVVYTGHGVTVTVTSYTQNHTTASFSGRLENAYYGGGLEDAKKFPKYIDITDGKMDLLR